MHPEIEKLIDLALADGQITKKEREIILRKAEKLGLDVDKLEIYLEGEIYLKNGEKVGLNQIQNKITDSKKNYEIREIKTILPHKLDSQTKLLKEIENKEKRLKILKEDLIRLDKEFEISYDFYHTKNEEKKEILMNLEKKQTEYYNFKNKFIENYALKTKDELKKNKKYNLKFNIKDLTSKEFELDFLIIDIRVKFIINNSVWKNLGIPYLYFASLFLLFMSLSMFYFDGLKNYYYLLFSAICFIILLFSKSQNILKNSSENDSLTLKGRDILFNRLIDFFINNVEPHFVNEVNKMIEIKNNVNVHLNELKAIDNESIFLQEKFNLSSESIINEINLTKSELESIEYSIKLEKDLKKFPSQAIGSVTLYNKLNEKYRLYDENQFNKIIRFLEHIEIKEKNYRNLYVTFTNDYVSAPETISIQELKKEQKEINDCYKLLIVLVDEVNGDVVKFNKVYNKLEDSGLFLSVPEKKNLQYLDEISTKIDSAMEGLKVVFKSIEESNKNLREINQNTAEISYNTIGLHDMLWDINMNTLQ